jgi:hypothetical protein
MRFDEILGKKITLSLVRSTTHYKVTLRGAEAGGIWVEGAKLNALVGHKPTRVTRPQSTAPPTRPIFFIPYSQIVFAAYLSVDLSE